MRKAACFLMLVVGCGAQIDQSVERTTPALATPIPRGVYSGAGDCDVTTLSPGGSSSSDTINLAVTFEINESGVPIVQGEEVRAGRSVSIGGLVADYTSIRATPNGVVWQFDTSGGVDDVTFGGIAISELRMTDSSALEYRFTHTWTDSAGFGYNQFCTIILLP